MTGSARREEPTSRAEIARELVVGPSRVSVARTALALATLRRKVLVGRRFRIVGRRRISVAPGARLRLGTLYYGFLTGHEWSIIRVRGSLRLDGNVTVATGNRWDVGPDATVSVGARTYFAPDGLLISNSGIRIGSECAIGWRVQLLDDDMHRHLAAGEVVERGTAPDIEIGDHVWIGSHAQIYKGVRIADGCIVAGGSVVTSSVTEPRTLVGGNPARVIRRDVSWR